MVWLLRHTQFPIFSCSGLEAGNLPVSIGESPWLFKCSSLILLPFPGRYLIASTKRMSINTPAAHTGRIQVALAAALNAFGWLVVRQDRCGGFLQTSWYPPRCLHACSPKTLNKILSARYLYVLLHRWAFPGLIARLLSISSPVRI